MDATKRRPIGGMVPSARFRRRFLLFLLPGLYQAAVSFLTLPLTTQILGPADFALYSLTSAISALLVTVSQLGSAFTLAQRFPSSTGVERSRLVSTIFLQSLAISVLCALLTFALWPIARSHWPAVGGISMEMFAMVMVATIGSSLYALANTLAVYGYAPGYLALITMLKATVSAVVALLALFAFNLGVVSLFLGQFAAGVVDLIGLVLLMLPLLAWRFDRGVARECLRIGGWNSVAHLTMQGRQLLERSVLSTAAGLHGLGLFVHAQQYQGCAMLGVRSIQQAAVPAMLEEAVDPSAGFRRTGRATRVLFLAVTTLGLGFALLGKEFIHALTNGKFDAAAPYAGLLIGVLLLQSAGRPQYARLLSGGRGRYLSACNIVSVAGSAALLVALAPRFGLAAAVAAIYLQFALFRLAIELEALRSGRMPFQDLSALFGIALIGATTAAVELWSPGIWVRGGLLLGGIAAAAAFNRPAIRDLMEQVRAAWSASSLGVGTAAVSPARHRPQEKREP